MTSKEKLSELEEEIRAAKQMESEALARADAAEAKLAKAERDYEISQMWLKAIEESRKKREEAKAAEYAKAVEAAEYRRKQNEAERAERLRYENMTPEELEARKENADRKWKKCSVSVTESFLKSWEVPKQWQNIRRSRKKNLLFSGQNVRKCSRRKRQNTKHILEG